MEAGYVTVATSTVDLVTLVEPVGSLTWQSRPIRNEPSLVTGTCLAVWVYADLSDVAFHRHVRPSNAGAIGRLPRRPRWIVEDLRQRN